MKRTVFVLVVGMAVAGLSVGLAGAAPAEKAPEGGPPAGPPPPPPELDGFMKAFDGSWKCDSKFFANAFGPGSPEMTMKSTVKFKRDLDGHFWRGDFEIKKSKTSPAMKAIFYVGYDAGTNRFVITGLDNAGGFGTGAGPAEGETVTFMGEQTWAGKKMKTRETMGKTSPKEGFHKIEVDMGSGYVPFGEDTCKR